MDDEVVESEDDAEETRVPDTQYWQYVGHEERVYTNVPVTVNRHDVIEWHELPADDGNWRTCDTTNIDNGDFTVKRPDNAPPIEAPEGE